MIALILKHFFYYKIRINQEKDLNSKKLARIYLSTLKISLREY